MKILFENCEILTVCADMSVRRERYLAVTDDKITYIGNDRPEGSFDRVISCAGKILMPGLFNCHTHAPMVLLRGVGSDLPLNKWLFEKVFPIENKLTEKDIEVGTDLAMLEMIAGGTVSFSDMYFFPHVTCERVLASGMKANISRPVQSFVPDEDPLDSERIKESVKLFEEYNGLGNGRLLIDFCVHAEYTCTEKVTAYLAEICNERNGNLHIHLSETEKEHNECIEKYGVTPAEWFERLGCFDNGGFAAHCVTLTDKDVDILKNHSVSIVHNPTSNMKLGSGFARITDYLDKGINVALGTDGAASNNNLDMFEELHLASVIHNGYLRDATVMKADQILQMATVNGAAVQRRPDCGQLKVGAKADIVMLSCDKPHMRPNLDPISLTVYSAQSSDVCLTMCDGKILYENGEYKTLDKEKIFFETEKAIERLYGG